MKKIVALAAVVLLVISAVVYTSLGMTKKNNSITKETMQITLPSKDSTKNVEKKDNSFEKYIKLIGLSKKDLISTLGEQPTIVDEGGLEFKKVGIRVWFKDYGAGPVQQVYTDKKDVDFNGVKIGDKISKFKSLFGKPVKEDLSSAYSNFKYKGIVLSVYYDAKTQKTFAAYVLSEIIR